MLNNRAILLWIIVSVLSIILLSCTSKQNSRSVDSSRQELTNKSFIEDNQRGLVCFWDFGSDEPFQSKLALDYKLKPANDLLERIVLNGESCVYFEEGAYLDIPREKCPELNFQGPNSDFTIIAKINRKSKSYEQCETIAGMWNETGKKRQYCLFLNLMIKESANQVCGHVSYVGGSTPGEKWAMDASIGSTPVPFNEWITVAFSFDGKTAKSFINNRLDSRELLNPYLFEHELFDGGSEGADFTVGAVHRLGEMGNYFVGGISKLAVYNRALSEEEIKNITF